MTFFYHLLGAFRCVTRNLQSHRKENSIYSEQVRFHDEETSNRCPHHEYQTTLLKVHGSLLNTLNANQDVPFPKDFPIREDHHSRASTKQNQGGLLYREQFQPLLLRAYPQWNGPTGSHSLYNFQQKTLHDPELHMRDRTL